MIVTKINDQEGIVTLSKKKVDELVGFDNISKAKEEDAVLDGVVLNVVKGGILVSVDGVRVFVPASQTGLGRDKNLDELLKQKVLLRLLQKLRGKLLRLHFGKLLKSARFIRAKLSLLQITALSLISAELTEWFTFPSFHGAESSIQVRL